MRSLRRHVERIIAVACLLIGSVVRAEDWPQFLGPQRDGTSSEKIAITWPKEGPKKSWEKELGAGFAGPVVADGKVFIFHRPGESERLDCLDAESGKVIWSNGCPATYRDDFGFDPG